MNTPEKPEFNVEFMAKMLKAREKNGQSKTVLFLGSRTGNLFRRNSLADLLKDLSEHTFLGTTPIKRFHSCYHTLENFEDSDKHDFISTALKDKRVELADICMAELMKQGFFNFIITTNIGNELEDAFRQSDMIEHSDFEVVAPEWGDSLFEMRKGLLFKLIKASGSCYSKVYSIGDYTIGSDKIHLDHYPGLRASLKEVEQKNMLMVGFDYKWDKHIMDAILPRKGGDLWYVNEGHTKEDSPLSFLLERSKAKQLEGTMGSYELFFMNLCWHVLGSIPSYPETLEKINKMQKTLHEVRDMETILTEIRDTQRQFQNNIGILTETVNKHFEGQGTTMKSIKDDINTLLIRSTSSSNTSANSSNSILGWQGNGDSSEEISKEK